MRTLHKMVSVVALLALALLLGCAEPQPEEKTDKTSAHQHEGGDALKWNRTIQHEGFTIKLGYHGSVVHSGEPVEPAISITRDQHAVADAEVYNSLIAADKTTVLAAEVRTVYEEATDDEEAHYAQGNLEVPKDVTKALIRYRIKLPGITEEASYDDDIAPHSH